MPKAKKDGGLSEREKRFADEYIIDLNGTQAAIRAGYAQSSARSKASKMLSNVVVLDYIAERKAALDKKIENRYAISKDRVLNEYARVAFTDIRAFFDAGNNLKDFNDLTDDEAAALSSVEIDEQTLHGVVIGRTKKVKVYDKLRALDGIAKVMGYNAAEKRDLSSTDGTMTPKGVVIDPSTLSESQLEVFLDAIRNNVDSAQ